MDKGHQSTEQGDLRSEVVFPANGNFHDRKAHLPGKDQLFHVEAKAVDPLEGRNGLGHPVVEKLEPALRVGDGQPSQEADVHVEHPTGEVTSQRLAHADE